MSVDNAISGLGLGTDTRGNYADNGEIIRKAKALTTRHDLSIRIGEPSGNWTKNDSARAM